MFVLTRYTVSYTPVLIENIISYGNFVINLYITSSSFLHGFKRFQTVHGRREPTSNNIFLSYIINIILSNYILLYTPRQSGSQLFFLFHGPFVDFQNVNSHAPSSHHKLIYFFLYILQLFNHTCKDSSYLILFIDNTINYEIQTM